MANEEEEKSTSEQIKDTFAMLMNKRLSHTYWLMAASAINLAILSSVFVKLMVDTMEDQPKWKDEEDRTSHALLCMLGLGCGEILGSVAWGKITDKLPMPQVIVINAVAMSVGYGFLFLYTVIYDFAYYLGILMTFFWGVQDSGMNCLLSSLLGF